jgi:hypothetical protein
MAPFTGRRFSDLSHAPCAGGDIGPWWVEAIGGHDIRSFVILTSVVASIIDGRHAPVHARAPNRATSAHLRLSR